MMLRETTGFLGWIGGLIGRHKAVGVLIASLIGLWLSGLLAFMLDLDVVVLRHVFIQVVFRSLCITAFIVWLLQLPENADDWGDIAGVFIIFVVVVCVVLGVMQYESAAPACDVLCRSCGGMAEAK